jgi:hypothetical protein
LIFVPRVISLKWKSWLDRDQLGIVKIIMLGYDT